MSKGDNRRPSQITEAEWEANFESVFGVKKLNIMSEEERAGLEAEKEKLAAETERQAHETIDANDGG